MVSISNTHLTETDPLSEGGVGRTSLLIAAWRADEAERIDPLVIDSIANIFVPPATRRWVEEMTRTSESTRQLISYRTRFFDDALVAEFKRGVKQVVVLGAGLDTRSLRLGGAGVTFYEVDCEAVLSYKQRQLADHGYAAEASVYVPGDYIRDDVWALLKARGFDAGAETFFIWEGNTMYIPAEAIIAFLGRLKAEVPRFRIAFDYLSEELIARDTGFSSAGKLVAGFESAGAPWVTGFTDIARLAERAGLALVEDKRIVDVMPPSRFRVALDRELFRHYSVCTLSNHE